MSFDFNGRTALITGASSGLGVEFAEQLSARGAAVILVARRAERLEELAEKLRATGGSAKVIPMDLAVPQAGATLRQVVQEAGLEVDMLINNAGFGIGASVLKTDPAQLDQMLDLNVRALTGITRAFLPELLKRPSAAIVNVASTAAYQATPWMAAYGASKAYVLSFTEGLWVETQGSGLRVLAVSPGPTKTEFFEVAGADPTALGAQQSAADVVRTTLSALTDHNRPSVVSGRRNALVALSGRIPPRHLVAKMSGRLLGPSKR
ncbi:SDR family NAD(P)-dependent oxidoreductase [Dermacoccaceae bacterium W4C1]